VALVPDLAQPSATVLALDAHVLPSLVDVQRWLAEQQGNRN
jgi:hypothetical protein